MTRPSTDFPIRIARELAYPSGNGTAQKMDLYIPTTDVARVPVVIWLHGGGWFTGDRTLAPDLAVHAAATGCAFASIDYRLSGEATFPAPLEDVLSAVRHLRASAASLGLDGQRIGLWGASAGAHLAALAALVASSGRYAIGEDATVRCVAACYPPVDLGRLIEDASDRAQWNQTPEGRLLGMDPNTTSGRSLLAEANPLTWVTPNAPHFLISHGTADVLVPHEHGQLLYEALQMQGNQAELYLVEGYGHGFINPPGRLDVELAAVMDDGRLQSEGRAAALRFCRVDSEPQRTTFGFRDIEQFLTRHLVTTHGATQP